MLTEQFILISFKFTFIELLLPNIVSKNKKSPWKFVTLLLVVNILYIFDFSKLDENLTPYLRFTKFNSQYKDRHVIK